MQAAAAMARGLSVITSDQDPSASAEIPADDLVLVNPRRLSHQPEPVVEYPAAPPHSVVIHASNAIVDHNANTSGSHSSQTQISSESAVATAAASVEAGDRIVGSIESSDIISDYGNEQESYTSFLPATRPLPSLQDTRSAGQVLFTQFCRQHLPSSVPLEVLQDSIPEQVPPEVNHLMQ